MNPSIKEIASLTLDIDRRLDNLKKITMIMMDDLCGVLPEKYSSITLQSLKEQLLAAQEESKIRIERLEREWDV